MRENPSQNNLDLSFPQENTPNQVSPKGQEPLASRMRPQSLNEIVGQEHILAPKKPLRRAIEADQIGSTLLYGPPGSGKTSLARIIASLTKTHFEEINATESSVAELRTLCSQAKKRLQSSPPQATTVFIDEIHRFNKAQQDALLPHVERGTLRLIGATTENPFFAINGPLVSRSQIFQLQPLQEKQILEVIQQALENKERGLGNLKVVLDPKAALMLAQRCDGDARRALNGLELATKTTSPEPPENFINIGIREIEESIQKKAFFYDRDGDNHYDSISAFIKSMRGSDPNATLYWLARMLESGEEPRYIARRIVIHASEDVGLADPSALLVATAAQNAVETIGMPEAKIPLAQAALHVALAPKSNSSCQGISSALAYVNSNLAPPVPTHLRDTHYPGAKKLGNGENYLFPHSFPGGWVNQSYLPDEIKQPFYLPSNHGKEAELNARLQIIKSIKNPK